MRQYAIDFETTTDINDCRVWAYGVCSIDNNYHFNYGNSIDDCMEFLSMHDSDTFYFHNLKFDGEFIINWLFRNNYVYCEEKKVLPGEFNCLISDMGQFYSMEICFHNSSKVKIIDSLKILPFSVSQVAKAFGLEESKLEIDYDKYRPRGYVLDKKEVAYLKNDAVIMAKALHILFKQGLNKMTQGGNALHDYKHMLGEKRFKKLYPILEYDDFIRKSYKGGYTYVKKGKEGKEIGQGRVYDVNSLYPYVMYSKLLPYGNGIYYEGKYQNDDVYPLYVQEFKCSFELKKGYLPTLQIKNSRSFFKPNEYLESSEGKIVTLVMTNVDIELFFEHYEVEDIEYIRGYKFKGANGLFKNYIDKWLKIKIESSKNGNHAMRTLAKLMLNALYGKFGLNPVVKSKIPYLGSDGIVHYSMRDEENREPVYIPMASFITAYAREYTIKSGQNNYDRVVYFDTDSMHIEGLDYPKGITIDDNNLGAWKHESTFKKAIFHRQKCYIEETYLERDNLNSDTFDKITASGMTKRCYSSIDLEKNENANFRELYNRELKNGNEINNGVTFENFKLGKSFIGNFSFTHCVGGIVLVPKVFTLRE